MKLWKAGEVPATAAAVFRESASGKRVALAVFSALFVAVVVVGAEVRGRDAGLPLLVVCVLGAATFLLLAALSFASLRATRRPSSWVLRVDPEGLSIKFRSYLNHHLPAEDLIAVQLAHAAVNLARQTYGYGLREAREFVGLAGTFILCETYGTSCPTNEGLVYGAIYGAAVAPGEQWEDVPSSVVHSGDELREPSPGVRWAIVPLLGHRRAVAIVVSF